MEKGRGAKQLLRQSTRLDTISTVTEGTSCGEGVWHMALFLLVLLAASISAYNLRLNLIHEGRPGCFNSIGVG